MSTKPKSVMIVEDEMMTQRYLKDILAEQKITVSTAVDNGTDALTYLEKNYCDLILMDINIKGSLDGLRLAKRILKKHDICIIFITAFSDDDTIEEAVELSPYGFIVKPFDPDDVNIAIQIGYKRFHVYQSEKEIKHKSGFKEESKLIAISRHLTYDSLNKTLLENNIPLSLSARQLDLVDLLTKNINNVVSKETIIINVWGDVSVSDFSLRSLIYGLRKQIPSLPLVTYSKIGYMLKSEKPFS